MADNVRQSESHSYNNEGFSGDSSEENQDRSNGHVQDTHFPHPTTSQQPSTKTSNKVGDETKATIVATTNNNSKKEKDDDDDDDDEPDLSCGLGPLRTNVFGRRFANLYVFAICFGMSGLFTSMTRAVVRVQLKSMEKQFNINNMQAGFFETADRITYAATILFVGHFAKRFHIPLTVGLAACVQGLLFTVPALLQAVDPYELPIIPAAKHHDSNVTDVGDNYQYLCNAWPVNGTNSTVPIEKSEEANKFVYIMVLAVMACKGITDSFHNSLLPILYMDDNMVDKSKMSVFIGIWTILAEFDGPIGQQINSIMSKVPVDLKDTEMDSEDGRFVSAWWLAFLIFGLGCMVASFPLVLFPRRLISKKKARAALAKAQITFAGGHVDDEVVEEPIGDQKNVSSGPTATEVVEVTSDLASSKRSRYSVKSKGSYRGSLVDSPRGSAKGRAEGRRRSSLFPPVVGPTERRVSMEGDLVFDQPVKEEKKSGGFLSHFSDVSATLLRLVKLPAYLLMLVDIVLIAVPLSGISMFRQAYMSNEYNVPMSEVAWMSGITSAVGHIGGALFSSFLCRRVSTKIGYTAVIALAYFVIIIINPFYFILGCNNEKVYGAKGEIGVAVNTSGICDCTNSEQLISCGQDGHNYLSPCYAGCSDVDGKLFTECTLLSNGTSVKPGLCETDCHLNFVLYAVTYGMQSFFNSAAWIPRRLLTVRIVEPQDRGFSVSIFSFGFALAAIPSSNMFGRVIDGTCFIWDGDFCSLYDRDRIRYLLSGIDLSVHFSLELTAIFMLIIFLVEARRVKREDKQGPPQPVPDIEVQVEAAAQDELMEKTDFEGTGKENQNLEDMSKENNKPDDVVKTRL